MFTNALRGWWVTVLVDENRAAGSVVTSMTTAWPRWSRPGRGLGSAHGACREVAAAQSLVAKSAGRAARPTIVAVRRVRPRATRRINESCRRLRYVLVVISKGGGTGAKCAMVAPVRLARDRGGFGFVAPIGLCELARAYTS
jgi:hypothetical protein